MKFKLILMFFFIISSTAQSYALSIPSEMSVEKFNSFEQLKIDLRQNHSVKVLFFWASWCERCVEFSRVLSSYTNIKGIEIFSIATDDKKNDSSHAQTSKYAQFKKNSGWLSVEKRKSLGVEILPVVALVDSSGNVDTIYVGSQTDKVHYFERRLKMLVPDQERDVQL